MIKDLKWQDMGSNWAKELNENDYVSFNPSIPANPIDQFGILIGQDNQIGKSETALRLNGEWYILNGDFRKEIDECKNIEEVKELFINKYKTVGSNWSTFKEN